MKKSVFLFIIISFALFAGSCKKNSPAIEDARSFYREITLLADTYADKLDTVQDEKQAIQIINEYVNEQKKIIAKGKNIAVKYPEYNMHNDPSLREYEKNLENATKKFTLSMTSIIKRYTHMKEFKDALKKFDEIAEEAENR